MWPSAVMTMPSVPIPIHAAVFPVLPIDTFHQVPEFHRVDFFLAGDVEVGALEYCVQGQVGAEADMLAERRDDLFHSGNQFVAVAEMIQHDDAAAWFTDPDHFIDDLAIIRYGRDDVGSHHGVEAVVRKIHLACIHQHQTHMIEMIVGLALSGFRQHA